MTSSYNFEILGVIHYSSKKAQGGEKSRKEMSVEGRNLLSEREDGRPDNFYFSRVVNRVPHLKVPTQLSKEASEKTLSWLVMLVRKGQQTLSEKGGLELLSQARLFSLSSKWEDKPHDAFGKLPSMESIAKLLEIGEAEKLSWIDFKKPISESEIDALSRTKTH